jgi:hypothetical protein
MFTFVNGRWVKDKTLRYGILRGYHSHILKGKFPVAVVHVTMDPSLVDVNVHPAKTELRFQYPSEVQNLLALAIRDKLRSMHSPKDGFYLVESWNAVATAADGNTPKTNALQDGLHLGTLGAMLIGRVAAEVAAPALPAFDAMTDLAKSLRDKLAASAEELLGYGSVLRVVERAELLATARAVAAQIAAKDPRVVRAAKQSLNGIDPVDVRKSYRFEQGFTFELNLTGVSDELRDHFSGTDKAGSK